MFQSKVMILSSAILVLCSAAAIFDKITKKCGFTESECLQAIYTDILREAADNGISELGVPKIDPFELKNRELSILGMINIIVKDGEATGFKNCVGNGFVNDIENLRTKVSLICENFSISGKYRIEVTSVLKALIGTIDIHGEGQGSIVIDKVKLDLDIAYEVKKHENGEFHFVMKPEDSSYTFELLDKITFDADNIFIGKQDISTVTVNVLNENWEFIGKNFGKPVLDVAMQAFYDNGQKVLDAFPVKDVITTDLAPYVKA